MEGPAEAQQCSSTVNRGIRANNIWMRIYALLFCHLQPDAMQWQPDGGATVSDHLSCYKQRSTVNRVMSLCF